MIITAYGVVFGRLEGCTEQWMGSSAAGAQQIIPEGRGGTLPMRTLPMKSDCSMGEKEKPSMSEIAGPLIHACRRDDPRFFLLLGWL